MAKSPSSLLTKQQSIPLSPWLRILLLCLILLLFAKLTWWLDGKTLWWDESLSLQRAEGDWLSLLLGKLMIQDGLSQIQTQDQHPFLFFVLMGVVVRLAGESEYALRFVSVMAGVLLGPAIWVLGRRLERAQALAAGAAYWTLFLTVISPFFLWYGQEARPYMLWAFLAVLSTYLLLRWGGQLTGPGWQIPRLLAYLFTLLLFLTTHFFSILLFLVHSILLFQGVARRSLRLAILITAVLGIIVSLMAGLAGWLLLSQPGAGSNFQPISLPILAWDLLNALSLGLSVNIEQVWWLDLLFGALALLAASWGLRSRRTIGQGGWILPAFVLVPTLLLFAVNLVQPVYMNARHLTLISGGFVLLVGGGLALLMGLPWGGKWAISLIVACLTIGSGYSVVNYYTQPAYSKGPDLARVGTHLRQLLQPGDLLLLDPPFAWRFFAYYLPLNTIDRLGDSFNLAWRGAPLIDQTWPQTFEQLERWRHSYRRIWLVTETTHPYLDPDLRVETWLVENGFRIWDHDYFSPNAELDMDLFLPSPPIISSLPEHVTGRLNVLFGGQIALRGYELGERVTAESGVPVTLYWDPLVAIDQRYKYKLWLVGTHSDGSQTAYPPTEKEPYDGFLPTLWWRPGPLIFEYSQVEAPPELDPQMTFSLHLLLYHMETLETLSITDLMGDALPEIDQELILPFPLPNHP